MNKFNMRKLLYNGAWIIITVCVAVFFVVALCVYINVEPSGDTELLSLDGKYSINELCVMSGDLEAYPYVTKVYEYTTDGDGVNICWINDDSVWREKVDYGIVTDGSAEHNYRVECFVYSNIADKRLVKRTWGVTATESDVLTLVESKAPYFARHYQEIGDIKKGSFNKEGSNELRYNTFIRITVKPSFDSVEIEVRSRNSVVAH